MREKSHIDYLAGACGARPDNVCARGNGTKIVECAEFSKISAEMRERIKINRRRYDREEVT